MPAVSTYQNTVEHITVSFFGFALADLSSFFLNLFPNGTIYNRFMYILEDNHVFRIILDTGCDGAVVSNSAVPAFLQDAIVCLLDHFKIGSVDFGSIFLVYIILNRRI